MYVGEYGEVVEICLGLGVTNYRCGKSKGGVLWYRMQEMRLLCCGVHDTRWD